MEVGKREASNARDYRQIRIGLLYFLTNSKLRRTVF